MKAGFGCGVVASLALGAPGKSSFSVLGGGEDVVCSSLMSPFGAISSTFTLLLDAAGLSGGVAVFVRGTAGSGGVEDECLGDRDGDREAGTAEGSDEEVAGTTEDSAEGGGYKNKCQNLGNCI